MKTMSPGGRCDSGMVIQGLKEITSSRSSEPSCCAEVTRQLLLAWPATIFSHHFL